MSQIIFQNDIGTLKFSGDRSFQLAIYELLGLGTPEKTYQTRNYIDFDGQTTISSTFNPRTISMAFDITYGDVSEMSAKIYRIFSKGGTLYIDFKNKSRRIEVNQVSVDSFSSHGSSLRSFVVQFTCDNPYFSDNSPITKPCYETVKNICFDNEAQSWNLDTPTVWGTNNNDVILINSGDSLVYPLITVYSTGDADSNNGIELLRVNPDKPDEILQRFAITHALSDGEVISICFNQRSDINRRYIKSNLGTNLLNSRTEDSSLDNFFLVPGKNRIILNNLSYGNVISATVHYDNQYVEGVY
ncbi:MAG: hypothetical protein E7415_05970 [Ruminococcaceae bacterium]|nr:hypothetical protein [Oscillospiraceae bacterium]